ncbi:MAG TPA: hypothetical protein DCK95_02335 [Anaerolineaceae bacterium]|nr:hypothetical protein [Anaerolineaceae bacterium]
MKKLINWTHKFTQISFFAVAVMCFPLTSFSNMFHRSLPSITSSTNFHQSDRAENKTSISVTPYNCPIWGTCTELPILRFHVEGIIADNSEYSLRIAINGQKYYFDNMDVKFQLPWTFSNGSLLEYWFENEEGSIFAKNHFYYRLMTLNEETSLKRIELLGHQWQGLIPTYALAWNIFPPLESSDTGWEIQYENLSDISTSNDYAFLAGKLIWNGTVNANNCSNSGLEANGAANTCGTDAAYSEVVNWQNAHDAEILRAAKSTRIPPKLIKGIIALESQFWSNWEIEDEYGLGMVTENGVDMLLKWNQPYFTQKCSSLYNDTVCAGGYFGLYDVQIQHLIGYVLQDIGTDQEYTLIAEILNAASMQTAQVIYNYTHQTASTVADFETLWRITLGIYNAGCGCMGKAIEKSWKESNKTLTWESISRHLEGDCASAKDYFDKVILLSH